MLETLADRARVAVALGEPIYLTEDEYTKLREHLVWNTEPPAGQPRYSWQPDLDWFHGVEIVIDFDRALMQGNRYGMTISELVSLKAERDAAVEAGMRFLRRLWPDP